MDGSADAPALGPLFTPRSLPRRPVHAVIKALLLL